MAMIVIQDSFLKELKTLIFRHKVVKGFLRYNQRKMAFDPENNLIVPPIKAFTVPPNIKISNLFFERLKKAFNDVVIDPFIRSLFETSTSDSSN